MKFCIPRKQLSKQNAFAIFLNATNRRYTTTTKSDYTVFEIEQPTFSQDAVTIELFYNTLMNI